MEERKEGGKRQTERRERKRGREEEKSFHRDKKRQWIFRSWQRRREPGPQHQNPPDLVPRWMYQDHISLEGNPTIRSRDELWITVLILTVNLALSVCGNSLP